MLAPLRSVVIFTRIYLKIVPWHVSLTVIKSKASKGYKYAFILFLLRGKYVFTNTVLGRL